MKSCYFNPLLIIFIIFCFNTFSFGQNNNSSKSYHLNWTEPITYGLHSEEGKQALSFEDAQFDLFSSNLPYLYKELPVSGSEEVVSVSIINPSYASLTSDERNIIKDEVIEASHSITVDNSIIKKQNASFVKIYPVRRNPNTGVLEKLISFDLDINTVKATRSRINKSNTYADNSVLKTGNWYKIGVVESKVYKLTYSFLKNLGMNLENVNPQHIRLYGNGGGKLPELNSISRPDDLLENAIEVHDGNDGVFNQGDYILFYGEGPVEWNYDPIKKAYKHIANNYSDTNFYFITADLGVGKRITDQNGSSLASTQTISSFMDYKVYEKDQVNLIKSGAEWLGDVYDSKTEYNYSFHFPNVITDSVAKVRFYGVARSAVSSLFTINVAGESFNTPVSSTDITYYADRYANTTVLQEDFQPNSDVIKVNVKYNKPQSSSIGWLNYIELSAWRRLELSGDQVQFRNPYANSGSAVYEYGIDNVSAQTKIWDITDPKNVANQIYSLNGSLASFRKQSSEVKEFLAFNRADSNVFAIGKVVNQNLHGIGQIDMAIVSHPKFLSPAQELANFHQNNGLKVIVVTPQQIYNEFSSGAQDAVAIRTFMKMFYDRANTSEEMPSYLLLFGDASYDLKNKINGNTNYVISFPSNEYLYPPYSYVSDDYFGFLDDTEGTWTKDDKLDLGIGRLPVQTQQQAKDMVKKITRYASASSLGDWRNNLAFVGDNEKNVDVHSTQADELTKIVKDSARVFNISKIYMDAFPKVVTPGGNRYPGVNQAITQKVEKGSLVINYTGHGGETGWAEERILTINEVLNWSNLNNLPLFITATCEFARYDDPMRTSGGEYALLNPEGGAIGLLTTTRLVFSSSNFSLSQVLYKKIFERINGVPLTMGEIYRKVKIAKSNDANTRNFIYLGDPAVRLAVPMHKVVTTSINGKPTSQMDTLKALTTVTIEGYVSDHLTGQKMQNFNGFVYPTVFDKERTVTTLNNDNDGSMVYKVQDSRIFNGKATVKNGEFSFSFVVPKDISYNMGKGKISYYADNMQTDAHGYSTDFIIGGSSDSVITDDEGPEIAAFLNSEDFIYGGMTNETPTLIANLSDDQGINTVGNGIGHDITLVIDGDSENAINLNEYYEAEVDNFQKGKVEYKMSTLSEGKHTATIKAWDVTNKSAETTVEFVVVKEKDIEIDHVLNYPNPFTTHTEFWFEHNQPGIPLDVKIQIFTVSGKLVKSIDQLVVSEGFRVNDITWNGLDDFGDKIGKGVYLYKLKVRSRNGTMAEKIEKLVVL